MNIELFTTDAATTQEEIQYVYVVDAELAYIGGGTAVVDY